VIDPILISCGAVGGFFALCCVVHADGIYRWFWLSCLLGHCFVFGAGVGHMWGSAPSLVGSLLLGIVAGAFPFVWLHRPRRSMSPEVAAQTVSDLDEESFNNVCAASIERMRRSCPGP
jgi:hypothetical protein